MPEPSLQFSVICPRCALESLSELPIALIANHLLTGKAIRLHSQCHDLYWTATFAERQILRGSLATLRVEATSRAPRCPDEFRPLTDSLFSESS
jgi:hypothetical protein